MWQLNVSRNNIHQLCRHLKNMYIFWIHKHSGTSFIGWKNERVTCVPFNLKKLCSKMIFTCNWWCGLLLWIKIWKLLMNTPKGTVWTCNIFLMHKHSVTFFRGKKNERGKHVVILYSHTNPGNRSTWQWCSNYYKILQRATFLLVILMASSG
jgi:hypothetical protein